MAILRGTIYPGQITRLGAVQITGRTASAFVAATGLARRPNGCAFTVTDVPHEVRVFGDDDMLTLRFEADPWLVETGDELVLDLEDGAPRGSLAIVNGAEAFVCHVLARSDGALLARIRDTLSGPLPEPDALGPESRTAWRRAMTDTLRAIVAAEFGRLAPHALANALAERDLALAFVEVPELVVQPALAANSMEAWSELLNLLEAVERQFGAEAVPVSSGDLERISARFLAAGDLEEPR